MMLKYVHRIHVIAINIYTNANKCFTSRDSCALMLPPSPSNEIESDQWVSFGIPRIDVFLCALYVCVQMDIDMNKRIHLNPKSLKHICREDSCAYTVHCVYKCTEFGLNWRYDADKQYWIMCIIIIIFCLNCEFVNTLWYEAFCSIFRERVSLVYMNTFEWGYAPIEWIHCVRCTGNVKKYFNIRVLCDTFMYCVDPTSGIRPLKKSLRSQRTNKWLNKNEGMKIYPMFGTNGK